MESLYLGLLVWVAALVPVLAFFAGAKRLSQFDEDEDEEESDQEIAVEFFTDSRDDKEGNRDES